jgi:putative salt-induced outer membrane protein
MVAETGGTATLIVDSDNTTLALNSGLEAKISDRLSTRLSYTLNYDSNPPPQGVTTDTMTRFTMVYGF